MISLSRMRTLIKYERRLKWNREKKLARATRTTSTLTGMPRGSGNHSQTESGALDLVEIDEAYRELLEELREMREELDPMLMELDNPDDRGIMRLRYEDGHTVDEIWELVNLSDRAVYYHVRKAERELVRKFPERLME